MRRYFDADKLKEFIDKQYKYCHGYTGTKKDVYRESLLAVKSAIHCQSVSEDMLKAEAYKEFAERVRECCNHNDDLSADAWLSVTTDINCVLKEMVGEENDR